MCRLVCWLRCVFLSVHFSSVRFSAVLRAFVCNHMHVLGCNAVSFYLSVKCSRTPRSFCLFIFMVHVCLLAAHGIWDQSDSSMPVLQGGYEPPNFCMCVYLIWKWKCKRRAVAVCVDVCVCAYNSNNKYCPSSTSTAAVNVQGLDWLPHPSEPGGGKEGAKGRDFQFIFTVNRDVRDS